MTAIMKHGQLEDSVACGSVQVGSDLSMAIGLGIGLGSGSGSGFDSVIGLG